jgi:hypothetical protein
MYCFGMTGLRWIGLAVVMVIVGLGAYAAWLLYGGWPPPPGYSFPRHSMWGQGPAALFEGSLQNMDGCIRTIGETIGDRTFAIVWPPGYDLFLDKADSRPVIRGAWRELRLGEPVRMGGGYYESGDPPPTSRAIDGCAPPYFLSTGFTGD